ncbi:MAG TPA: DNA translocase FtsK 4TM domain-containing protein, partial [Terriglobales bacterium]
MKVFSQVFTPTNNRRLNELVGFLLLVSALLLFLAIASYSPLDPSFNTASAPLPSRPSRNWIGIVGAYGSDLLLQFAGIAAFLMPVFFGLLGGRWFRSRKVESPAARVLGAGSLLVFAAAFLGLLPWHWRWLHAIPIEGLLGRVAADVLIHFFNLIGAYLVCASAIAVALYLSTAFSFGALRLWLETRFAFAFALRDRFQDW